MKGCLRCRLGVEEESHQRFVNLMRQSHVLPYVPLPGTGDSGADDTMFAVLQPVDGVADNTLERFTEAHAVRHAWRAASTQDAAEGSGGDDDDDFTPQDPRKKAQPGCPVGQVRIGLTTIDYASRSVGIRL